MLSFGITSYAQVNNVDISGDFGYKYNESYHGVTFSEKDKTFIEYDKNKNIVSKGIIEIKDDFYILTPKEIITSATINVPVRFKVKEIQPKKIVVEVYYNDKKSQILNLVKL